MNYKLNDRAIEMLENLESNHKKRLEQLQAQANRDYQQQLQNILTGIMVASNVPNNASFNQAEMRFEWEENTNHLVENATA